MKLNNNMLLGGITVVVIIAFIVYHFSTQGSFKFSLEKFEENKPTSNNMMKNNNNNMSMSMPSNPQPMGDGLPPNASPTPTPVGSPAPMSVEGMDNNMGMAGCYPKDQLSPQELLPQDYSSTWAKCNPQGAGSLEGKNFLESGWHVGINTVGQTLRNANLQLRSEPPAPQVKVSPWLQSTIEPDTNRRYFEIGSY